MRFDVHHHIVLSPEVRGRLDFQSHKLDRILANQETFMSALDDLKSAISDLGTALTDNNAEIELLLGKISTPGTSDADIAAAVADIRGLITANKAEVDKAKAAVPA